MSLESATYISGLVETNPTGSDPIASGDDHLRLIKATLKATFPGVTGAVTKTHTQLNNAVDKTGDTMSGPLVLSGPPTDSLHAATKAYVDSATGISGIIDALYPVGTVYTNATNSANPATLFGFGTWVAFGSGKVTVGYDGSDTDFNAAGKTGGSKDAIVVSHTHTATTSVTDPGHTHVEHFPVNGGSLGQNLYSGGTGQDASFSGIRTESATTGISVTTTVNSTGSSGTGANLQPYVVVYMWKRTA